MLKLVGVTLVIAIFGTGYFYMRLKESQRPVRLIPVATNDTDTQSTGRNPASFALVSAHYQINEQTLNSFEQHTDQLRTYAQAEPVEGGWQLHILPADQVFAKAGFHDGDKITFESLRNQAEAMNDPRLAERMVDTLRRIER
jgi:hypothetical protein